MTDQSTNRTFVFEGQEVIATGRVAVKRSDRGKSDRRLYEITPADPEIRTWKKWVTQDSLYLIIEQEDNKNEEP